MGDAVEWHCRLFHPVLTTAQYCYCVCQPGSRLWEHC